MQVPENILSLIEKYQSGTISPQELELLNKWYHSFDDSSTEVYLEDEKLEELVRQIGSRNLTSIKTDEQVKKGYFRKWLVPVAATIVLALGLILFKVILPGKKAKEVAAADSRSPLVNDIAPGGNKAVLILADGSSVILDSTSNGVITRQGAIQVKKLNNGLLVYSINGKEITENDAAFYNTISTPRGGQYQVTLSDGTQVWLNAASSIRFPVVFKGSSRNVEITGEAYFEAAKNASMPFVVKTASSKVEVLGTHFNINAYEDEASVKTTLLEGLVKVSSEGQSPKFLRPGQQSGITKDGNISILNNADIEEVMAWKNGRFQYKSAELKTILRQIARWYDVDIEYRGNVNLHFTGQLPRSENVSRVFEKLKMTGEINFRIEGRKIIVSP